MPTVGEMFPSKYLKGQDLPGPVTVTIQRVGLEQVYKPSERRQADTWILYCVKAQKGVILTRTLAGQIAEAVGSPNTDEWNGKRVTLYPQPMTVAGVQRVAIRAQAATNGNGQVTHEG